MLDHPNDHPIVYLISGPYYGDGDTYGVYEVARREKPDRSYSVSTHKNYSAAERSAKRARCDNNEPGSPIFRRHPGDDWTRVI